MNNITMQPVAKKQKPVIGSWRIEGELHARVAAAAEQSGYSLNAFVNNALEGILELIDAPEGKMVAPRIVNIARFMRDHKPPKVKGRE